MVSILSFTPPSPTVLQQQNPGKAEFTFTSPKIMFTKVTRENITNKIKYNNTRKTLHYNNNKTQRFFAHSDHPRPVGDWGPLLIHYGNYKI